MHELESLTPEEQRARGTELLDTRFTPSWLDTHPGDRALADLLVEHRAADRSEEAKRGMAEQLAARSHHDVCDRLGRVSSPTLVASGRYDGIAPPANGEVIAAGIPGAELRLYEGGHAFIAQDPAAFPDLMEFLAG